LAYKFTLSDEERVFHFSEAAKMGHEAALEYTLDELLFRANSLTRANPQLAYDIYVQAKKLNPSIKLYEENEKVEIMRKCIEAGPFDAAAFMKKYRIKEFEDNGYKIWELAEEASIGGRFGKPDPWLVFQLVCRGGSVPAELTYAVNETYSNWKLNKIAEFRIIDFVSSGAGASYCSDREDKRVNKMIKRRLLSLSDKMDDSTKVLLQNAFIAASVFFEGKSRVEKGHGGSSKGSQDIESAIAQKEGYLKLIENLCLGRTPKILSNGENLDELLNKTLKNVIYSVKQDSVYITDFNIDADEIKVVQKLWKPYCNSSAKLFTILYPSITESEWREWLIKTRIKDLNEILELAKIPYN